MSRDHIATLVIGVEVGSEVTFTRFTSGGFGIVVKGRAEDRDKVNGIGIDAELAPLVAAFFSQKPPEEPKT